MRRLMIFALLLSAACATPPIRLSQVWQLGDERAYRLVDDATITLRLPDQTDVQRAALRARATFTVLSVDGDETTVRLKLEPDRFTIDGVPRDQPAQDVELVYGPDGSVRRIATIGGVPAGIAGDVEDLAPLLGAPLPGERVRVGQRWARTVAAPVAPGSPVPLEPGTQTGRLAGLRVVQGYDCALVRLGTTRQVVRQREISGQALSLLGTEYSTSEVAFAFRDGFPVSLRTTAEGRFEIGGGSGGDVTIRRTSALTLED